MKISARHPPRSPSEPMGHPPTFRPDRPDRPAGFIASQPPRPAALHAQLPHRLPRQPPSAPIAFRAKRQGQDPQHVPLPCSPKRRGRILQREL